MLLRSIYTDWVPDNDNLCSDEHTITINQQLKLISWYQKPQQSITNDLKYLFETGLYADACLAFINPHEDLTRRQLDLCSACNCRAEYSCHQAILAARSKFLRRHIIKNAFTTLPMSSDNYSKIADSRMKLKLFDNIIPRRYAKFILHVFYCDSNDIVEVLNSILCHCRRPASSDCNMYYTNEIMNDLKLSDCNQDISSSAIDSPLNSQHIDDLKTLYNIGLYLESQALIKQCEDLIVSAINPETINSILKWTTFSNGSQFVYRQALNYLLEHFHEISAQQHVFQQLEPAILLQIVQSDYLQSSEQELALAILDWAAYRAKIIEEHYEPGEFTRLLKEWRQSSSCYELARLGKFFSKIEILEEAQQLRVFVRELIECIRFECMPSVDFESLTLLIENERFAQMRDLFFGTNYKLQELENHCGKFTLPRFFMPYVVEARKQLYTRLTNPHADSSDRSCYMTHADSSPLLRKHLSRSTSSLTFDTTHCYERNEPTHFVSQERQNIQENAKFDCLFLADRLSAASETNQCLVCSTIDAHCNNYYDEHNQTSSDDCWGEVSIMNKMLLNCDLADLNCTLDESVVKVLESKQHVILGDRAISALKLSLHSICHILKYIQLRLVREMSVSGAYALVLHWKTCNIARASSENAGPADSNRLISNFSEDDNNLDHHAANQNKITSTYANIGDNLNCTHVSAALAVNPYQPEHVTSVPPKLPPRLPVHRRAKSFRNRDSRELCPDSFTKGQRKPIATPRTSRAAHNQL